MFKPKYTLAQTIAKYNNRRSKTKFGLAYLERLRGLPHYYLMGSTYAFEFKGKQPDIAYKPNSIEDMFRVICECDASLLFMDGPEEIKFCPGLDRMRRYINVWVENSLLVTFRMNSRKDKINTLWLVKEFEVLHPSVTLIKNYRRRIDSSFYLDKPKPRFIVRCPGESYCSHIENSEKEDDGCNIIYRHGRFFVTKKYNGTGEELLEIKNNILREE